MGLFVVLSLGNILYFLFWSLNKEFLAFLGFLVFWFFSLGFGSVIPDRIWSQELGISEALQNYTSLKKIISVIKYSTVSFSLCVLLRNAPLSILASLSRKLSIHVCAAHSDKQFSCFFSQSQANVQIYYIWCWSNTKKISLPNSCFHFSVSSFVFGNNCSWVFTAPLP